MSGSEGQGSESRRAQVLIGGLFIAAGVNHFVAPRAYRAIVPPSMKSKASLLVALSGVAEIAGGAGVLIEGTRRSAGLGLIALLAAVFPANLYMARAPEDFPKIPAGRSTRGCPCSP